MSSRFKFVLLLAASALAACASALPPLPSAADATRVQARFTGSSVESLREGRTLYVGRCGSCHALRDPSSLPPDAWAGEVRDMRAKGVRLNSEDEQRITAYLVAVSSR
jgi:cytochrome c5